MSKQFLVASVLGLSMLARAGQTQAAITADDDPILFWNEQAVTLLPGGPPVQTRGYAMVNIAMHDAVNAVLGKPNISYLKGVSAPTVGDTRAAASTAARNVLYALDTDPGRRAQYDAALAASLALVPDGAAKEAGVAAGAAYATAIVAKRAGDGAFPVLTSPGNTDPGQWRPTSAAPGAFASWGGVTPFQMTSGSQFRPAAPPSLSSAAYAEAYNEVKLIGAAGAELAGDRTVDQSASALFWDNATGAPWMRIGLTVAEDEALDTIGFARTFALLSTSLADALIAGFDSKYHYNLWRPVTAIRLGDLDGNALTEADAGWTPLFGAPAHPSYLSTHSALSGAGASVLTALLGDDEGFSFTIAKSTREFTGLQQAAQDGADSRLWGGIHFRFDNEAGLATGQSIGRWALAGSAFNAVPEPATWAFLVTGFELVGVVARKRQASAARSA